MKSNSSLADFVAYIIFKNVFATIWYSDFLITFFLVYNFCFALVRSSALALCANMVCFRTVYRFCDEKV